ncbi:MAG: hypothetical protein QNK37_24235 [Acidobacteriota bacterium]|nr:hypothetical protein [Acidobacteriota bacterium]
MKLLKLFYLACGVFLIVYFVIVLSPPPAYKSVWRVFAEREDPVVTEILEPETTKQRRMQLIEAAYDETMLSLLVREGYLAEDMEAGKILERTDHLAAFDAEEVLLIAEKIRANQHHRAELVSVPTLLTVAAQRNGGPSLPALHLCAWDMFSARKTPNRVKVLNNVLQWADAPTTAAFLKEIGVVGQDGEIQPTLIKVLPVPSLEIIQDNLAEGSYDDLRRKLYLGFMSAGTGVEDHRGAHLLTLVTRQLQARPDDSWTTGTLAAMVELADDDMVNRFLHYVGFMGRNAGGNLWFAPEVLKDVPMEIREQLARHLETGHVTPGENRAALALRSEG